MMNDDVRFNLRGQNPDILSCLANLSNDEIFTPPELANRMLDTLADAWATDNSGSNIWADSNLRFLDPCTKSGVFLREITKRLILGLAVEFPDLPRRVDHILTKQVFGIGITQLTALLARRTLYCSKHARGKHSVASSLHDNDGNIWFKRTEHLWSNEQCTYCGASEGLQYKDINSDTHAYAFIHFSNTNSQLAELFRGNMKFDVIIGNPPYQLNDVSGSASASPIYQKFIEQAIALQPRYLTMVAPSRWFSGGKGLNDFRKNMLSDRRIRSVVDFIVDKDAFPGVNVNGGVNYFLWNRDSEGDCAVVTIERGGKASIPESRRLDEFDIFVRRSAAVAILRKVSAKKENTFDVGVSPRKPFGLPPNFFGADKRTGTKLVKLHCSGRVTWIAPSELKANAAWVQRWKVLIGRATDGNEKYPLPIWDQRGPIVAGPGEACTETYLVAALAENKEEAEMIASYMRTVFFRFLVSLRKMTQDNKAEIFKFVPAIPMNREWTDKKLQQRYALSDLDVAFMRSMVRDMAFIK
jgi:hypothetical protein